MFAACNDDMASLGWLMQPRATSPGAGAAAPAPHPLRSLEPAEETGRRSRRHLGQRRAAPYTLSKAGRSAGAGAKMVYWSSHGETGVTEDGDELDVSRPPFSFTCLIGMAILKSGASHISVGGIYRYMVTHFPYFATAKQTWRNSVRHVLSLGRYFCKRTKGSTQHDEIGPCVGKGAVWGIKGAALPVLLQHIEAGAAQLQPRTAKHLELGGLATAAAAVAAAADPTLPASFPDLLCDLGDLGSLDDLDGIDGIGGVGGVGELCQPGSPTDSYASSCSEFGDFEVPDLELAVTGIQLPLLPQQPAPPQHPQHQQHQQHQQQHQQHQQDWLEKSIDDRLVLDISALLEHRVVPSHPASERHPLHELAELPAVESSWFGTGADTAIASY